MENTLTTESMDMVLTLGKMVDSILAFGQMENNMGKEFTDKLQAKREKEFGKREKESNGLMMMLNDYKISNAFYYIFINSKNSFRQSV